MVSKRKIRLLLSDDDADDRELFSEAISEIDPAIILMVAEDREKLMKQLKDVSNFPDLIFLDLNMLRKNGKECLVEIQLDEDLQKIPIIIYSTSISSKDIYDVWSKGAIGFMRKPDSDTKLKEFVQKIIDQDFGKWESGQKEKILINL